MFFTDMIYPGRCALCDDILNRKEKYVCRECRKNVRFLEGPKCCRCGRPIRDADSELCYACAKRNSFFDEGLAPFAYDKIMIPSLMRFKYGHRAEYADFYAAAILFYGGAKIRRWKAQAVLPVPVHRRRMIRRGYNQAEEIAGRVAAGLNIPDLGRYVRRVKNTKPQKNLNDVQRRNNLRNSFRIDPGIKLPERVMIVDDIFTTGSTIDAMAAEARKRGAEKVFFVCAAIGSARQ